MSDYLKLLTKDYFNRHPIKDISAARIEYSLLLQPKIMDLVDEVIPILKAQGLSFPDNSDAITAVVQEEDTARLLRMLRRGMPPSARRILLDKLLAREEEACSTCKGVGESGRCFDSGRADQPFG